MNLFDSVFRAGADQGVPFAGFLLCILVSMMIGALLAAVMSRTVSGKNSVSFLLSVAVIPVTVCVVIMMVNGNIGAGVAVAGAFSLVRYRSAPGRGDEIAAVFLSMACGLLAGMGYLAYAVLFAVVVSAFFICAASVLRKSSNKRPVKELRITVPEDLNYTGTFAQVLEEFTESCELKSVKTSNMGSLYRLRYEIVLKDPDRTREMIDALRCRNGNLEVAIMDQEEKEDVL